MGVPTVATSGINIVSYALDYDFLYSNGMPIRYVAFPFPIAGQPRSVHKTYVAGKDQLSKNPLMTAIIDALTKPLTDHEKITGSSVYGEAEPRFLPPDTEENLQRLFKDKEWTDYNPIILPTEERVKRMLAGTSHKPDA